MKVSLNLENSHSNDVTIVVDALRASTTIITALENFQTIIPVKNIEDATKLASENFAVLAGERRGAPVKGFDTGNSPVEIQNFSGEVLVLTTTNGTRILEGLKSKVLVGSFVNAKAVAEKALDIAENHIEVIMAGVNGRFAIEDFLGAGEIISHLQDQELDELALASVMASQDKIAVNEAVKNSKSAQGLYELGLGEDVDFCLKRNLYDTVPVYKNRKIRRNL
ncbi:2-phosphosulfolactate phosphatase [Methanobacterium congolense]|uniref:2-phosphosulfolactate phosphatase n=1 Tax=Methanobacterium congolense TaxID=118062 RepID=A0A1D3L4K5_9EURY|nr:2-phosphosulfolactate phosphatase [Methanobacterium congolense]SCG86547.1 2-phosphosulfolactate phosphatase [Methanobacterium congolense]